jgi:hypothetical protein
MSVTIPVRAFAAAADCAAWLFDETVADLFDASKPSRARFVAIHAVIKLYPDAPQIEIAECFGWVAGGRALKAALTGARCAAWWRRADVARVCDETRRALGDIKLADIVTGDEPVQRISEEDRRATQYTPRVYRPSRLVTTTARRAPNVTALMMGDPPPGRREMLATLESPRYSAGVEGKPRRDLVPRGEGPLSFASYETGDR